MPPRQDLAILGITYRRIPLLAIGNDVYADTTLILRELERRFPQGGLDTDPRRSLECAESSNGMFHFAAGCIPSSLPIMKDEKFVKDRSQFNGRVRFFFSRRGGVGEVEVWGVGVWGDCADFWGVELEEGGYGCGTAKGLWVQLLVGGDGW